VAVDAPSVPPQLREHNLAAAKDAREARKGPWVVKSACSLRCTSSEQMLGELFPVVHGLYEQGHTDIELVTDAKELHLKLSYGAVARHRRNHLARPDGFDDGSDDGEGSLDSVDNVWALEQVIARGTKAALTSGRISPDLLVRAIDLHEKLTHGKKMDSTLTAISDAINVGFEEADAVESPMDASVRLAKDPNDDPNLRD
jgi:hypothetical protein